MEVLELSKEERGENGIESRDKIETLAFVDALVIA